MHLIAFCLIAALVAPNTLAQSNLLLPSSTDDYRKLVKPKQTGPCTTCGVVTNVHMQQIDLEKPVLETTPGGPVLHGTPIIGTGTAVQDARKSSRQENWKVTVRYDNGQYATFDQDDEPSIRKGDKVQVVEGRVEPR
jgi:hypothetical protein